MFYIIYFLLLYSIIYYFSMTMLFDLEEFSIMLWSVFHNSDHKIYERKNWGKITFEEFHLLFSHRKANLKMVFQWNRFLNIFVHAFVMCIHPSQSFSIDKLFFWFRPRCFHQINAIISIIQLILLTAKRRSTNFYTVFAAWVNNQ